MENVYLSVRVEQNRNAFKLQNFWDMGHSSVARNSRNSVRDCLSSSRREITARKYVNNLVCSLISSCRSRQTASFWTARACVAIIEWKIRACIQRGSLESMKRADTRAAREFNSRSYRVINCIVVRESRTLCLLCCPCQTYAAAKGPRSQLPATAVFSTMMHLPLSFAFRLLLHLPLCFIGYSTVTIVA